MSGLTRGEARIMDLWDSGAAMERIARETGMPLARVRDIVHNWHGGESQADANRRTAQGSASLLAAIERARAA